MGSANPINIVEVGPRDGLQNQKEILPAALRLQFIQKLFAAGVNTLEAGSFVRPDKIPQLADSEQLAQMLTPAERQRSVFLIPNVRGLERALAVGVQQLAVFVAASDAFSEKNMGLSMAAALATVQDIFSKAAGKELRIRGYVSVVFGCPYAGRVALKTVVGMVKSLLDCGCYEVSLGDTIGVATPKAVRQVLGALLQEFSPAQLAVHFHDTQGMAMANIHEAVGLGIRTVDAAAGGLGGCPYAQGASGNVATEDVVYYTQKEGFECGISLEKLAQASLFLQSHLAGTVLPSKVLKALISQGKV